MSKKTIDWERIEAEYRAGQLSIREIARRNKITHVAIHKKAKKHAWSRDLSQKIKSRVKELVTAEVTEADVKAEKEIIEGAARRGAEVHRLQRDDIAQLRKEENRLLTELGLGPTKLWVGQYQGKVITKELDLTVSERAAALRDLSTVQHKRIQLERQAYNLNDGGNDDDPLAALLRKIANQGANRELDPWDD